MNTQTKPLLPQDFGAELLTWKAPLKVQHAHSPRWFAAAAAVMVGCILFALYTGGWTFLVVLGLLVFLYWQSHAGDQHQEKIVIFEKGIVMGNTVMPWKELNGFWLLQSPEYLELHLERNRGLDRHKKIQTGALPYEKIQAVLVPHLTEFTDRKERILDYLERLLKI